MGEVLQFLAPSKKLTGFLPPDLGRSPPMVVIQDPLLSFNSIFFSSVVIWATLATSLAAFWLTQQ